MPADGGTQFQKPKSLSEIKHFAKISRAIVLRKMAADQCFSSRVYWALVLLSYCGPEKTDGAVVQKDAAGYIKRDANGAPIPAQQKDILALLHLDQGMKSNLSKAIARFIENEQVWTDDVGIMYVNPDPPAFEASESVGSTANWKIADRTIKYSDLDPDPVGNTASIQCLEALSTAWKKDLQELRTRYRQSLIQAISEGRILIDKRSRGVEEQASKELPACLPPEEGQDEEPQEEENTAETAPVPAETAAQSIERLRDLFPGKVLRPDGLQRLNSFLEEKLNGEYSADDYIAFVRARQREGPIGPGLVFNLEDGLPRDYVDIVRKAREESAKRPPPQVVPQESAAESQRRNEWARAVLADPASSEQDRMIAELWLEEAAT